jgi:Na+-driven multidrug efflux pump
MGDCPALQPRGMDHDHAVPNLVVMLAQAAANFMESYYVGLLGVDALAGAALVFPLVILIQTMSSGGMGAELPPRSLAR